jgi:hypothetical protein
MSGGRIIMVNFYGILKGFCVYTERGELCNKSQIESARKKLFMNFLKWRNLNMLKK